ncbi:MAG: 6-phosphogluconolactonase [Anaerolineae bacterium]
MDAQVIVVPDPAALAAKAAERFAAAAQEAAPSRGRFGVALSGGSTPRALFRVLASEPYQGQIPWAQTHIFWGDERCVPPNDPNSNYYLAHETLLGHISIPPENIHRIRGELEPEAAARAYDRELQDVYCGPRPRFDLVLLGLGRDGHTASLFPGSPALHEAEQLAVAVQAEYEDRPAQRVTLTLPAIKTARQVLFLVAGADKSEIVRAVLEGPGGQLPAQMVSPTAGRFVWLLDAAAASQLTANAQPAAAGLG